MEAGATPALAAEVVVIEDIVVSSHQSPLNVLKSSCYSPTLSILLSDSLSQSRFVIGIKVSAPPTYCKVAF